MVPSDCNKPFLYDKENPMIISGGNPQQDSTGQKQQTKQEIDEVWTTEYLVDQLFLNLVRAKEFVSGGNGETISVRKYYRQARQLMYWIPVVKLQSNEFIVFVSDLSPRVRKHLESIIVTPTTLRYVLTQAVGRIFENLDFDYFHLSVAQNLRIRLEK